MSTATETLPQTNRTFVLDPKHSVVGFTIRHMMIATSRGQFSGISGFITLPLEGNVPLFVEAEIDAASIDTRDEQRDSHVKAADFLDVLAYPSMQFRSTIIEGTESAFRIVGDLTIHGIANEVVFDATFGGVVRDPWGNQRLGYEASAGINRQNFGIGFNNALESGALIVGNHVRIELSIEAIAVDGEGDVR